MKTPLDLSMHEMRAVAADAAKKADEAAYASEIVPAGLLKEKRKPRRIRMKILNRMTLPLRNRIGRSKRTSPALKRRVGR